MANLIIDQGNSFTKIYVFDKKKILFSTKSPNYNLQIISQIETIKQSYLINAAIYSSVAENDKNIIKSIKQIPFHIIFSPQTPIPIENLYRSKNSLGTDRLAAAVGANYLFPKRNILVIDIGTAITYEFINDKGQYLGGNISPGPKIRFKALHQFTKRLPLVEMDYPQNFIGQSTHEAILNGVVFGIAQEIKGTINQAKNTFNNLKTILTGGHSVFFGKILKNSIFVEINLVPIGLNRVLEYNKKNL